MAPADCRVTSKRLALLWSGDCSVRVVPPLQAQEKAFESFVWEPMGRSVIQAECRKKPIIPLCHPFPIARKRPHSVLCTGLDRRTDLLEFLSSDMIFDRCRRSKHFTLRKSDPQVFPRMETLTHDPSKRIGQLGCNGVVNIRRKCRDHPLKCLDCRRRMNGGEH
jgi:hypothetical protein